MSTQLSGGVDINVELQHLQNLASNKDFYGDNFDDEARIMLMEEASPTFKSMPDDAKQEAYNNLKSEFQPTPWKSFTKNLGEGYKNYVARPLAQADAAVMGVVDPFADSMSMGIPDAMAGIFGQPTTKEFKLQQMKQSEQNLGFKPGELTGMYENPISNTAGSLIGMVNPKGAVAGLEKAGAWGVNQVARNLAKGGDFSRKLFHTLETGLGQPKLASKMLSSAAGFGAFEGIRGGAESMAEHGFDPLRNAGDALKAGVGGAALGAAFPPALEVGGKILKAGVSKLGGGPKSAWDMYFKPRMNQPHNGQSWNDEAEALLATLDDYANKIRTGAVKAEYFSDKLIADLSEAITTLRGYITAGQGKLSRELLSKMRNVETRVRATAKLKGKVDINKQIEELTTPEPKAAAQVLKGTAVEMVNQGLGDTGHTLDSVKTILGKLQAIKVDPRKEVIADMEAQLAEFPKGSRDAAATQLRKDIKELKAQLSAEKKELQEQLKDVHENVREVAGTEADLETGIGKQAAVDEGRQLLYAEVKKDIPEELQPLAEKIDDAIQNDKKVRIEYHAEITGRSRDGAKVTAAGNVKAEVTDFSPTNWYKTKDGKVMVEGYNQQGHLVKYHLAKSPEGSFIAKVVKVTEKPAFRGTHPNRVTGSRDYNVQDVLSREPRYLEGQGPTKTSEAMAELKGKVAKLEALLNNPNIPEPLKGVLRRMKAGKKLTAMDMLQLRKHIKSLKNDKVKQEFCDILGLAH